VSLVPVLGLATLLGLAWALSYHRRQARLRPVLWGIGLQLLLALAILRQDVWSYAGMVSLGLLIVGFIVDQGEHSLLAAWPRALAICAAALAAGLALYQLPSRALATAAVALAAALLVTARLRWPPRLRRAGGALLVVLGLTWMIRRGLYGQDVFQALGKGVAAFLDLAGYGARFLFGNLADPRHFGAGAGWPGFGFQFAFYLLPVIIFFAAFMAVLYHLGLMQVVIEALSRFLRWTIGTSGAETLSCSANIFIGQTEAPLLVRPYLAGTTRSELLTIMVGGFATIAGSGLAVYIAMGVPATHLLAASVMSAPAALVVAKIIYPELEHSATAGDVALPEVEVGSNLVEAASNGISDGLKLAANVAAMLIGFIALIALADVLLSFADSLIDGYLLAGDKVDYASGGSMSPVVSEYRGIFPGSLRTLFGTALKPLAWLMGVPWSEAAAVGHLLGVKITLNEFVAYGILEGHIQAADLSERSIAIATYALCGFANFTSIGVQIGGLSALVPERKRDLAQLGMKAMVGGALASWMTATVAGMLLE
jgi:concentrative nucleoside transporter, CNT family